MKPQLLLAEGNEKTDSPLIVFQAKMLRDSKHRGIFLTFCHFSTEGPFHC